MKTNEKAPAHSPEYYERVERVISSNFANLGPVFLSYEGINVNAECSKDRLDFTKNGISQT